MRTKVNIVGKKKKLDLEARAKGILRKEFFDSGKTLAQYFGVNCVWANQKRKSRSYEKSCLKKLDF